MKLWPDLVPRLDSEPRVGTLLVMCDKPDRKSKVHLPWATSAINPVGTSSASSVKSATRLGCHLT